ncbi:MAG: MopE-related protein [Myxococcota bacterium]|nr:MopE-related protein [Myxococcota bacterium]
MYLTVLLLSGCQQAVTNPELYVDSGYLVDGDGDGYSELEDCDDTDPTIHSGAVEVCDGIDNNCDGVVDEGVTQTFYVDSDGDGYGDANRPFAACVMPQGYSSNSSDCNDSSSTDYPNALEICDGFDNNCDGQGDLPPQFYYVDSDGDGYGDDTTAIELCETPSNMVDVGNDCDDSNIYVHPDAIEQCDGVDNNCDLQIDDGLLSIYYFDADGDGYGDAAHSLEACTQPSGYVSQPTDCNDFDSAIHPGASEICDGVDNDCDGQLDTAAECPCNVEVFGSHTYLYCENVSTWHEAYNACQSIPNFELVVVNDAAEQAWIWNVSSNYAVDYWWWLGYHNQSATASQEPAGMWEWVGGQSSSYSAPWHPHEPWPQPDDHLDNEDCAHIDPSHGFWNDLDCHINNWYGSSIYYICESVLP